MVLSLSNFWSSVSCASAHSCLSWYFFACAPDFGAGVWVLLDGKDSCWVFVACMAICAWGWVWTGSRFGLNVWKSGMWIRCRWSVLRFRTTILWCRSVWTEKILGCCGFDCVVRGRLCCVIFLGICWVGIALTTQALVGYGCTADVSRVGFMFIVYPFCVHEAMQTIRRDSFVLRVLYSPVMRIGPTRRAMSWAESRLCLMGGFYGIQKLFFVPLAPVSFRLAICVTSLLRSVSASLMIGFESGIIDCVRCLMWVGMATE